MEKEEISIVPDIELHCEICGYMISNIHKEQNYGTSYISTIKNGVCHMCFSHSLKQDYMIEDNVEPEIVTVTNEEVQEENTNIPITNVEKWCICMFYSAFVLLSAIVLYLTLT